MIPVSIALTSERELLAMRRIELLAAQREIGAYTCEIGKRVDLRPPQPLNRDGLDDDRRGQVMKHFEVPFLQRCRVAHDPFQTGTEQVPTFAGEPHEPNRLTVHRGRGELLADADQA